LIRFEFRSRTVLFCFPFILFRLENHVCFPHSVQVSGAAWCATTMIVSLIGDMVQRTGDGHTGWVLGGRAIERSGDAVCGLHLARGD
jgi:hypothetical protein